MGVVILDVCPKCRVDVSRRFGLIKTPLITCRKCGYTMRVTANAVRNNWQYNCVMVATLAIWLILACIILLDPKGATHFAGQLGKFKGTTSPWVLAGMSFVPAFLMALPFALVGRILGIQAASRILSERTQEPAAGDFSSPFFSSRSTSGRQELQSQRWAAALPTAPPSPSPEAPPSGRRTGKLFLRIVFGVLWMVAFFVAGSFATSDVVIALENGDQEARQQALEAAGRATGVPLFFGSIFLVVVLAILGWLPGFRRHKAASLDNETALPRSKPSDSRLILGR
jgi:hypothetical protein